MISNTHPFSDYAWKPFWVFLSGKEMLERKQWVKPRPVLHLLASLLWMAAGAAGIAWSFAQGGWARLLYLPAALLLVGGTRYMVATNIHMCVHGLMFKSKAANVAVAELFSTMLCVQGYHPYYKDHILLHHSAAFGTFEDSDTRAIYQLGFRAGRPAIEMWLNLAKLCVNPAFHLDYLAGRLRENFLTGPVYRRLMAVAWWSLMGAAAYHLGLGLWAAVYAVPVLYVYQVASILHFVCEHTWINARELFSRQRHQQLCIGRFCGSPAPRRADYAGRLHHYFADMALWVLNTVCVELPARICVFQGTLAVHDWHHRHGYDKAWANTAMLREQEIQEQLKGGETNYREVWGFVRVLDHVFNTMSQSKPFAEEDIERVGAAVRLN